MLNHCTSQVWVFPLNSFLFTDTHFLSTLSSSFPTACPRRRFRRSDTPTTSNPVVNRCRSAVNSAVRMPAPPTCSTRLAITHDAVSRVNLNLMDTNNWRADQSTEPNMDTSGWRGQLQPESRQRIVNKMNTVRTVHPRSTVRTVRIVQLISTGTLRKHLPVSGQEGLHELWRIAQRFEEKVFIFATSQNDYLRKISLKMLSMETQSYNTMANNIPSNQVSPSNKPSDPEDGEQLAEE